MSAPDKVWVDTFSKTDVGPTWLTKPVWASTEYIRADIAQAQIDQAKADARAEDRNRCLNIVEHVKRNGDISNWAKTELKAMIGDTNDWPNQPSRCDCRDAGTNPKA